MDLLSAYFARLALLPVAAAVLVGCSVAAAASRPSSARPPRRRNPLSHYRSPATDKRAGGPGDARHFAGWLRGLWREESPGVYVIRDVETREVLYVGKSERSVYERIARHLQHPAPSSEHQKRSSYDRRGVEVAIELLPADRVSEREADLVADLVPRDVLYPAPEVMEGDDAIPF